MAEGERPQRTSYHRATVGVERVSVGFVRSGKAWLCVALCTKAIQFYVSRLPEAARNQWHVFFSASRRLPFLGVPGIRRE